MDRAHAVLVNSPAQTNESCYSFNNSEEMINSLTGMYLTTISYLFLSLSAKQCVTSPNVRSLIRNIRLQLYITKRIA